MFFKIRICKIDSNLIVHFLREHKQPKLRINYLECFKSKPSIWFGQPLTLVVIISHGDGLESDMSLLYNVLLSFWKLVIHTHYNFLLSDDDKMVVVPLCNLQNGGPVMNACLQDLSGSCFIIPGYFFIIVRLSKSAKITTTDENVTVKWVLTNQISYFH